MSLLTGTETITLCGSTKFKKAFEEAQWRFALEGHIVHSLSGFGREEGDAGKDPNLPVLSAAQKRRLDLLHLIKIQESDAIFVIDVGGYIGESTTREIEWARLLGKQVYYLSHGMFAAEGSPKYDLWEACRG